MQLRTAIIDKCRKGDRDPKRPAKEQRWCLYAHKRGKGGKKLNKKGRLLGRHPSKKSAREQEAAIKAREGSVMKEKLIYLGHVYVEAAQPVVMPGRDTSTKLHLDVISYAWNQVKDKIDGNAALVDAIDDRLAMLGELYRDVRTSGVRRRAAEEEEDDEPQRMFAVALNHDELKMLELMWGGMNDPVYALHTKLRRPAWLDEDELDLLIQTAERFVEIESEDPESENQGVIDAASNLVYELGLLQNSDDNEYPEGVIQEFDMEMEE